MKHLFQIFLLVITLQAVTESDIQAEIKTPNYDFTLSSLELFFPGKTLEIALKSQPKSDLFEDRGDEKVYRFKLLRAGYVLDVYTQVKKDLIVDMYVRLPQHFIHDQMLADLQKRYKKQDHFIRKDLSALYVWKNRDGLNLIYHGSCSITCFPMFFEVVKASPDIVPFYQRFNEALPLWEIK